MLLLHELHKIVLLLSNTRMSQATNHRKVSAKYPYDSMSNEFYKRNK